MDEHTSQPPVLNMIGEKVALGPLRRELVSTYERWINDFEVTRSLALSFLTVTTLQEERWLEAQSQAPDAVTFTIYRKPTLEAIGTAGLMHIDLRQRTAEFGIMIGEKTAWGQGFGTETTSLVLDYAFSGLGLANVMLSVLETNHGGLKAYQRAGFKSIGRRRAAHQWGQRRIDVVLMDCVPGDRPGSSLDVLLG